MIKDPPWASFTAYKLYIHTIIIITPDTSTSSKLNICTALTGGTNEEENWKFNIDVCMHPMLPMINLSPIFNKPERP